jgi:hypothetical protein
MAFTGAMRALLEMGLFEALPSDGTGLPADALAEKLNVEKDLLSRPSPVYFSTQSSDFDSPTDANGCPRTFHRSGHTCLCTYALLAGIYESSD